MDRLIRISEKKIAATGTEFKRFMFDEIDWSQRLSLVLDTEGREKPPCFCKGPTLLMKNQFT